MNTPLQTQTLIQQQVGRHAIYKKAAKRVVKTERKRNRRDAEQTVSGLSDAQYRFSKLGSFVYLLWKLSNILN